jgi:hypothetical protein
VSSAAPITSLRRYCTTMASIRSPWLLVALAAMLVAVAATPATARAFDKGFWGPITYKGQSQFPVYNDLGVSVFQMQLHWDEIAPEARPTNPSDPTDPAYRWPPEVDQAIAQAQADGMSVALMIIGAPEWANGLHEFRWAPKDPEDYGAFALAAARRYPTVHRWQVWGEATRFESFQPLRPQTPGSIKLSPSAARAPKTYARLLDAAYVALKTASRSNVVIGGATVTTGSINPYAWATYLKLPNGKRPRFDQWSHNPFSARRPSFSNPPSPRRYVDFSDLKRYSRFLDDQFDRHVKIFLSEWTIPTDREDKEFNFWVSQETQATWIASALRISRKFPRITGLGWIHLYDDPPSPSGQPVIQSGLIQADGTHKPGYDAFKNG